MGAPVSIEIEKDGKQVKYTLSGEKIALLIGKRGQTLNSLQYLTQLVINRSSEHYLNVLVGCRTISRKKK